MSNAPISINLSITSTGGAVVTPPSNINATFINYVTMNDPGYTVLPAGLIEDLSSTGTYGIALVDSLAVDTINSLVPGTANPWLLTQIGQLIGVQQGIGSNTSVYVVFGGPPGFIVSRGFTVSDGIHQYIVQDGGIIAASGETSLLFCLAAASGIWAVPVGTVTTIVTSTPIGVSLICSNPETGTPGTGAQAEEDYRAQVMSAYQAPSQGTASYLKKLLKSVPGVQPRLTSVSQVNGGGWEVICGGGDPYQVGYAIYSSGIDISDLVGSTIGILSVTKANPGYAVTDLNHGLVTGQSNVYISGALGMTAINGGPYTVTVINETTFSFGVNTSGYPTYTGSGIVTPNPRNILADVNDYPDTYVIPFVNPPQQAVTVQLTWNSISPNLVSPTAVAQAAAPAVANYINSVSVGAPINEFELNAVFTEAVINLTAPQYIDRLVWTISINGVATAVATGTGAVYGDPESYFYCTSANVSIAQG